MAGFYDAFLTHLNVAGVSRLSHFSLLTPMPPVVTDPKFAGLPAILSMRCEGTDLPGRQLSSQDIKIYGPTYKVPHQSSYQEITLTFLETQSFIIRDFFERWMGAIWSERDNLLKYPNSYRVDMYLSQHSTTTLAGTLPQPNSPSNTGEFGLPIIAEWKLISAFPTAVNQMPVSWSEEGLHRVSVTLAYEYYVLTGDVQEDPGMVATSTPETARRDTLLDSALEKAKARLKSFLPF